MRKIIVWLIAVIFLGSSDGYAGEYLNSAHGTQNDAITGVKRLSAYTDGNCGHCHEQHASIDGSEPSPTGGPDNYLLFDTSHTSQTADFCFDCHVDASSQQTEGSQLTVGSGYIYNYSYTYRAGNYDDGINDIKQAFDIANTSYHQLDDIVTFITAKWGYTANSNPCCACHNPHAAQGDPAGSTSAKSSLTRGYPVSRPSLHTTLATWGLWGDGSTEQMNDYSSYYQAPYRNSSTTAYEPDGSSTTTGSNLTDFVTFCQDCHSYDMTAAPYSLSHTPIDWATLGTDESGGDKHGKKVATEDGTSGTYVNLVAPYAAAWTTATSANGLVLACTDCHEPHGAPNVMLIRKEVNGAVLGGTISPFSTINWVYLCARCHDFVTTTIEDIHHNNTGAPYVGVSGCGSSGCHINGNDAPINCEKCHFHGGDDAWAGVRSPGDATGRRTF